MPQNNGHAYKKAQLTIAKNPKENAFTYLSRHYYSFWWSRNVRMERRDFIKHRSAEDQNVIIQEKTVALLFAYLKQTNSEKHVHDFIICYHIHVLNGWIDLNRTYRLIRNVYESIHSMTAKRNQSASSGRAFLISRHWNTFFIYKEKESATSTCNATIIEHPGRHQK